MKNYAIRWTSSASGRIGIGTILFEKEEAERLVSELNEKYPDIDHEAVIPAPPCVEPPVPEPAQALRLLENDALPLPNPS